jgi:hypothetical protein
VAVVGLLYAFYYARPLILGQYNQHWRIRLDPVTDYDFPTQLVLEGWAALLVGFGLSKAFIRKRRAAVTGQYDPARLADIALWLVAAGAFYAPIQEWVKVPVIIAGLSRFVVAMGLFGTGLLTMLFVRGELAPVKKTLFFCLAGIPIVFQVVSGFIAGVLITASVIFLSIWVGGKRLTPRFVLSVILVLGATLTLKAVMSDYRKVAWLPGQNLSIATRVGLVATMADRRVSQDGLLATLDAGNSSTKRRSANLDLLADIVRRTPSQVPYWNGGSYLSLIGIAIPRFLWPDKPTKELGQRFGHRYSILDSKDNTTSFNLPFLVEFYANFGETGVILGMLLVGIIYRVLQTICNKPGDDPITAIAGIVLVLPLLNIESDFSLTFGGLLLDGIALLFALRKVREYVGLTNAGAAGAESQRPAPVGRAQFAGNGAGANWPRPAMPAQFSPRAPGRLGPPHSRADG